MPAVAPISMVPDPRRLPAAMADRLIIALDVPTIDAAKALVESLGDTVTFFKVGWWLTLAAGFDTLVRDLLDARKQVFLDAKIFDIGQTVEEGVARAADRGVNFLTVHGDRRIIESAVKGRRGSDLKLFAVTVLTSLGDQDLVEMGYRLNAEQLVRLRAGQAVQAGCDGIIASAHDDPDALRRIAGSDELLIATPGVRSTGHAADDHQRLATPEDAIRRGADYLVVGRQVIQDPDPAAAAGKIIREMSAGARARADRSGVRA